ncbi:MAG TPA: BON domain-containing protein [Terriglobales bacterium]|nr:BON domain-containing protein [Terriglobales bacterium]
MKPRRPWQKPEQEEDMKGLRNFILIAGSALLLGSATLVSAENSPVIPAATKSKLEKQIQHSLMMLPFFTPFDDVKFQLNGDTVTLTGAVLSPQRKQDAESAVKRVESVAKVNNQIEVLPASFFDDRLRLALARDGR